MWNLAFSFTIQYRGAAFKAYYAIRSFITFHGIFMAHGYIFGPGSFWRRAETETKEKNEFDINECEDHGGMVVDRLVCCLQNFPKIFSSYDNNKVMKLTLIHSQKLSAYNP